MQLTNYKRASCPMYVMCITGCRSDSRSRTPLGTIAGPGQGLCRGPPSRSSPAVLQSARPGRYFLRGVRLELHAIPGIYGSSLVLQAVTSLFDMAAIHTYVRHSQSVLLFMRCRWILRLTCPLRRTPCSVPSNRCLASWTGRSRQPASWRSIWPLPRTTHQLRSRRQHPVQQQRHRTMPSCVPCSTRS